VWRHARLCVKQLELEDVERKAAEEASSKDPTRDKAVAGARRSTLKKEGVAHTTDGDAAEQAKETADKKHKEAMASAMEHIKAAAAAAHEMKFEFGTWHGKLCR
jgi:hypothetical protein